MRLLLDTCVLLWLGAEPDQLGPLARKALDDKQSQLFSSAISAFEIGTKQRKGKLVLPRSAADWLAEVLGALSIEEVPITNEIALGAAVLAWEHGDPADRILVATALGQHMTLVTPDRGITSFARVPVIW
jgi:PIN domain nuclease of toxin-antitoxin system